MPSGGGHIIRATATPDRENAQRYGGYVRMILRAISDRVETMLKDTGPSISEQQVKRVFDPFISASGSTNAAWPWLACVQLRRGAVESGAAVDPAHAGLRQGADGHSGVGGCEQNHGGGGSHGKAVGQADHRRRVA